MLAKLVQITAILLCFMVDISILNAGYKPIYNWGVMSRFKWRQQIRQVGSSDVYQACGAFKRGIGPW